MSVERKPWDPLDGETSAEWDAFLEDFQQTLAKFHVPEQERRELLAIVDSTRADIVFGPTMA